MNPAVPAVAGYLWDGCLGDPPWLPHPVRAMGWVVALGDGWLNRGTPAWRIGAGGLLVVGLAAASAAAAWALVAVAGRQHPLLAAVASALGTGVLVARRSLATEAGTAVSGPLVAGDLVAARAALSRVVGRDTLELTATEIARAAVETVAENTSDGVTAPLFYTLLGGLPALAAYKAVNTLDSMIGHRDPRYLYFGRVAARLDDAANWLPARLTCLAMVAAAALQRRSPVAAWRAALAGAARHSSPNAGWPEAAMAGALGVRLGGTNTYDGVPHPGPVFNAAGRPPAAADVAAAVRLMHLSSHLFLAAGVIVRLLL